VVGPGRAIADLVTRRPARAAEDGARRTWRASAAWTSAPRLNIGVVIVVASSLGRIQAMDRPLDDR
jgi:hypothetical protein